MSGLPFIRIKIPWPFPDFFIDHKPVFEDTEDKFLANKSVTIEATEISSFVNVFWNNITFAN